MNKTYARWKQLVQELLPSLVDGGTPESGRLIPWKLADARSIGDDGKPRMSGELMAYISSTSPDIDISNRMKARNPKLTEFYAAYLRYRIAFPAGHVSKVNMQVFADQQRMGLSTCYRRIREAEELMLYEAGEELRANIAKRQQEDAEL